MSQPAPDLRREAELAPPAPRRTARTFTLAALMTGISLLAVCLAAMYYNLGLGIAALFILTLAVVRICLIGQRASSASRLPALLVAGLMVPCCFCAFFIAGGAATIGVFQIDYVLRLDDCTFNDNATLAGLLVGLIAAVQTAELLMRLSH